MKFWKFTLPALATLLAAVSASGPTEGEATADPNSAVVKLTADDFSSFITENPLVLAEFFAPWCGYCKVLGPEFAKAADDLNVSHPKIKLAQIDCTEEEQLCQDHGIKGYPSLKVVRGSAESIEDYEGPRTADGIVDYMIQQTLPVVQVPETVEALTEVFTKNTEAKRATIVQVLPAKLKKSSKASSAAYEEVANAKRKDLTFVSFSVSETDLVEGLDSLFENVDVKKDATKAQYFLVRPDSLDDVAVLDESTIDKAALTSFVESEIVPYFGEINRDTYLMYMNSPNPIGYYFYNKEEEKEAITETFNKLGKLYRGKINFVALDAVQFGRHAEILNMDPEIVPLFAIQKVSDNKKWGISQKDFPEGPTPEAIETFLVDFFDGKVKALTKSEDLPTPEEVAANPVVKLVTHNHEDIVNDVTKDVFVKYYAPWCGHCKTLAPKWEELAEIFGSNKPDAEVVIADIDHTANDVVTPFQIEGYPTLILYPANGEIDEETGLRKPITFESAREVPDLIDFLKEKGGHKADGHKLKKVVDAAKAKLAEAEKAAAKAAEKVAEKVSAKVEDDDEDDEEDEEIHDEL